jgi:hypothetical protein
MFKSFIKQNNDPNETCTYVHELLFHQTSSAVSVTVRELSIVQNMNVNFQLPFIFVFSFLTKMVLLKSC